MSKHPRRLEQLWVLAPEADLSRLEEKVNKSVSKFFDDITDNNSWKVLGPSGTYALWCRGKWVGSVLLWNSLEPIPAAAWRRALPPRAKAWRVHDDGMLWQIVGPEGEVMSSTPTPWQESDGPPDRNHRMLEAEGLLRTHLKEALMDVPACSAWINAIQDDRPNDLEDLLRDQFWTPEDIQEWWRFIKDYLLAPQPVTLWRDRTWGPVEESVPAVRQQKSSLALHAMACALPLYARQPARLNALLRAAEIGSWRVWSLGLWSVERVLRPWVQASVFWRLRGRTLNFESLEDPGIEAMSKLSDFRELPTRSAHAVLDSALALLRTSSGPSHPDSNETYDHLVWLHDAAPKWPHWLEVFNVLSTRAGASEAVRAVAAQLRSQHLAAQWKEPQASSRRSRM